MVQNNDIPLVKRMLIDRLGYPESNITALLDQQATHLGIQKQFKQLASRVHSGDMVYIHFSGHGSTIEDQGGDEWRNSDQTWVPYGARQGNEGKNDHDILDDEIYQWMAPIYQKTDDVVLISDSCFSGSVTRGIGMQVRAVPMDVRGYPEMNQQEKKHKVRPGVQIGG